MKIKTKYNIGDIIQFCSDRNELKVGKIVTLDIFIYDEREVSYGVKLFAGDLNLDNGIDLIEHKIIKKLNRKAFEKAYAEQCAKEIIRKGENDVKD